LLPDPVLSVRNSNPFAATIVGSLTSADLTELGFEGTPIPAANYFARLNPDTPIGRKLEERSKIFVLNAGMNTVVEVAASTGRSKVITRFPPLTNPLFPGVGGPVTDAVPTGIFARDDGTLLVSVLSGFPFAAGNAKVYSVDSTTGAFTPLIEGLTTATDVLEVGGATYVLEISTDFLGGAPGRLLRFATPTSAPTVLAGGLIGPTGLAYEPSRNELIVSETFTGLIRRVAITP
jgi:sugar lactone lactonase YvrE